jgi:hypothetical protein
MLKIYPVNVQKIFLFIKYITKSESRNSGNTECLCSYIMWEMGRENKCWCDGPLTADDINV